VDRNARSEVELERLGLVPADVRDHVIERDASCCRVCGRHVEYPALHHIVFRSQGGLDIPSNLVTIGWLPGHDCHLPIAHGPKARTVREVLLHIAERPGVTALQVARWNGLRLR
jgi:5-methylcytosine-specific restriction endonuclease McrA